MGEANEESWTGQTFSLIQPGLSVILLIDRQLLAGTQLDSVSILYVAVTP